MTHVDAEIAAQPACWARAAELAAAGPEGLPETGERVALVGCGTSLYMAQAGSVLREEAGLGETDAFPASEFPHRRGYDRVVALSRSGTTTEVVELLDRLRASGTPTTVVTAVDGSPAAEAAGSTVLLDFADERSVVQTRFATTALTLLRAHLGLLPETAARDAETALADGLEGLDDRTQYAFLGRGWTVGLAHEAALKMKEASLSWTESYPAMEYRHGPISIATTGTATWVIGDAPAGLADQVRATGARWVESALDPVAELVRVQRLAVAVAARRGLDPDRPRHLTRSVVLPAAATQATTSAQAQAPAPAPAPNASPAPTAPAAPGPSGTGSPRATHTDTPTAVPAAPGTAALPEPRP
jgi:fructoselysine-6-P-deglycase FrlB-like protein